MVLFDLEKPTLAVTPAVLVSAFVTAATVRSVSEAAVMVSKNGGKLRKLTLNRSFYRHRFLTTITPPLHLQRKWQDGIKPTL
ncbi:MAG: hypothetical protein AABY88_02080 [Pseudomonadota bacterium]